MDIYEHTISLKILKAIALCGEMPYTVLNLIYPKRKYALDRISALKKGEYISVVGNGDKKSIRLLDRGIERVCREGTPEWLQYRRMVGANILRGDFSHVYKNLRTAEAMILMESAGAGVAYMKKPGLRKKDEEPYADAVNYDAQPYFYTSREIKETDKEDINQIRSARMTGLYTTGAGIYAVYNAYKGVMELTVADELRIRNYIRQLVMPNRWNRANECDNETMDGMRNVVICRNIAAGVKILQDNAAQVQHKKFTAVDINGDGFKTAHFAPLNDDGVKMLKILACPDFKEKITKTCILQEQRQQMNIETDGYDKDSGTYIYLFLTAI